MALLAREIESHISAGSEDLSREMKILGDDLAKFLKMKYGSTHTTCNEWGKWKCSPFFRHSVTSLLTEKDERMTKEEAGFIAFASEQLSQLRKKHCPNDEHVLKRVVLKT